MTRVLIETQSWMPVDTAVGNSRFILISESVAIANTDGSAATTWSAQTGGTSSTANQVTDSRGVIAARWIEEGEYDITVRGAVKRVEATAAGIKLVGRKIAGLGDSILTTIGSIPWSVDSPAQAVLYSGGRLIYSAPYATDGYRSDQIAATHLRNAINGPAGIIVVLAGTNDISQGVANATIATNLLNMWRAIRNAGKLPIACSLPPNSGWTAAQRKQLRQLNLWIHSQSTILGMPFADFFAGLVDPTTGLYEASLLYADATNTHPNGNGSSVMGGLIVASLEPFVPGGAAPLIMFGDSSGGTGSGNLHDNPLFLRSTVSPPIPDSVIEAVAPSPANTYSTPAALAPGVGNVLKVVTGNAATATTLRLALNSTAVTAGDVLAFGFRVGWTPGTHAQLRVALINKDDGVTNIGGFKQWDVQIDWGAVWFEHVTVPNGVVNVEPRIYFDNDGSAAAPSTFMIGQITLHNLTTGAPVIVT